MARKREVVKLNRAYKPRGIESAAHDERQRLTNQFHNRFDKGIGLDQDGVSTVEEFGRKFPTAKHYIYWHSLFWFSHDLILQSEQKRRSLTFEKHFEFCGFLEKAVATCEYKHSLMGDPEKLKNYQLADNYFLEVSRGTFKTTYVMYCVIWIMWKHPEWTNLYARSIASDASVIIKAIGDLLKRESELHVYAPNLLIIEKQIKKRGGRINRKEILLPFPEENGDEEIFEAITISQDLRVEANITGWGLNETYTGAHINGIAFVDDAVTEKNYGSEVEQDKILGRFSELSSICMEPSIKMKIGTPYSEGDALQRNKMAFKKLQEEENKLGTGRTVAEYYYQPLLELKKPDGSYYDSEILLQYILSPKNKTERELGYSAIVFKESTSPSKIREKYWEACEGIGKKAFYSQYLLKMVSDDKKAFREEWIIRFGPGTPLGDGPRWDELRFTGMIDPSGGDKKGNDNAGILLYGVDARYNLWIYEGIEKRFTPISLMQEVYELNRMYKPHEWFMESYAMADWGRGLINMLWQSGKINIDGEELPFNLNIQRMESETGRTPNAKDRRIRGASWLFETGRVRVHTKCEQLVKRILEYPMPGRPDELPDLLGYAKERVFPLVDKSSDRVNETGTRDFKNPSDIMRADIQAIWDKHKRENAGVMTMCRKCGDENPIENTVCWSCGQEALYRGPMQPVEFDMQEEYILN